MKTMKLLFGLMAFSTMFLFDRCTEPGQQAESEKSNIVTAGEPSSIRRVANDTATGCACDNSARYNSPISEGGKEISIAAGKTMIKAFRDKYNNGTMGGFISKVALDSIFCNHADYNGVFCYIALDATSGRQLIVIEGYREADASGSTRTAITFDHEVPPNERYKVFATQTMCPAMCGNCAP